MRAVSLSLILCALVAGACGSAEGAGPRGEPVAIVRRAPERTVAQGHADVRANAPGVQSEGSVDLRSGTADVHVQGARTPNAFVTDPILALDVVRGAVRVRHYGGLEVQGVGTIKYELDVDPARALAATPPARRERLARAIPASKRFYADAFIDTQGRIRRVLLPVDLSVPRQYGDSKITNEEMTVDFFDFKRAA